MKISSDQPHEGNMFEFLYKRRSIERARVGGFRRIQTTHAVAQLTVRRFLLPSVRKYVIADSNALRDAGRIWPQHEAALTLLQSRLSNPKVTGVRWLDLACGRGQIISFLEQNLTKRARAKLRYFGYDARPDFLKETMRLASELGLKSHDGRHGDLSDFNKLYPHDLQFDFITLTNTVHEVKPTRFARLLCDCLARLSASGCLFIYDMELIDPPELGAVPWHRHEIARIVHCVCEALGIDGYEPEVGGWKHKTCDAWSIQIHREHLELATELTSVTLEPVVGQTASIIRVLLETKLSHCKKALNSLMEYGTETGAEHSAKQRLLFDYFALENALEDEE